MDIPCYIKRQIEPAMTKYTYCTKQYLSVKYLWAVWVVAVSLTLAKGSSVQYLSFCNLTCSIAEIQVIYIKVKIIINCHWLNGCAFTDRVNCKPVSAISRYYSLLSAISNVFLSVKQVFCVYAQLPWSLHVLVGHWLCHERKLTGCSEDIGFWWKNCTIWHAWIYIFLIRCSKL